MAKKPKTTGSLLSRIHSVGSIVQGGAHILDESQIFNDTDITTTNIRILNLALSGKLDGGFGRGITMFAGPSRHFKTMFALVMAKAYMDKHDDAQMVFFDNEFGAKPEYFQTLGIDTSRVTHVPFMNIEELKQATVHILDNITKEDNVIFIVDSIGNAASMKELDDVREQKTVADMTRAKQLKAYFRMITPIINMNNVPFIVINHTYLSQGMYPTDVVSGGTGGIYNADRIFIIGRRKSKDGTDVVGHEFILKAEKSRFAREGSKFPVTVTYESGIDPYSGLLDIAIAIGYVTSEKQGWFEPINPETGEVLTEKKWRRADTGCEEFWGPLFDNTNFKSDVEKAYTYGKNGSMVRDLESSLQVSRNENVDDS